MAVVDSVRIGEVFRNLFTNAIKYNQREDKSIEVGCTSRSEGLRVYFVRDNGIGIAPEFHRDIFTLFKRLNSESEEVRGTGDSGGNSTSAGPTLRGASQSITLRLTRNEAAITPIATYPPGTRAVQVPDSLTTSRFLDAFGRAERIQTCSCERTADASVTQALHLNNGYTLNDKLREIGRAHV